MFGDEGIYGGGERYALELARALSRRVDCRLVTFGARASRSRVAGLEVVVLRRRFALGGHPAHPVGSGLLSSLVYGELLHVHHMRSLPGLAAATLMKLRGAPTVATDHGLGRGSTGLSLKPYDAFLTVSQYSARKIGAPPERTVPIYGGVDPKRFCPSDAGRSGVLYVGRVTPHKGIDRLIRALPAGTCLTVAGTKGHDPREPERSYGRLLRSLAAGHEVTFLGRVSDDELVDLYRRAQVVALPTVEKTCFGRRVDIPELLGLSVLEAMSCGTPVVCSGVGGLPEVVVDGDTGFLVEPGNVNELRDRLQTLVSDRSLARRMGAAAREVVVERFTWDECAERCLAAYEELLSSAA